MVETAPAPPGFEHVVTSAETLVEETPDPAPHPLEAWATAPGQPFEPTIRRDLYLWRRAMMIGPTRDQGPFPTHVR
jgi:hypothetical protein